jgi:hypothetical protein
MGRHSMIPYELIQQRISYAIELKASGLPISSILEQINKKATETGWGEIGLRQLKRDIASYYAENDVVSDEEIDFIRGTIEMQREETEQIIEDLAIYAKNKTDWKPGEYERALKFLAELKMQYVEFFFINKIKTNKINITNYKNINPEKTSFFSQDAQEAMDKEWKEYPEQKEKLLFFIDLRLKYTNGEISEEEFLINLDKEHGFPSETCSTKTEYYIRMSVIGNTFIARRESLQNKKDTATTQT